MVMAPRIHIDSDRIAAFCRKWRIIEFALFGSVLRDDFCPHSDVDVLVTFSPDAPWDYFDWADMTEELKAIFGHEVDILEKDGLRNPYRRHAIYRSSQVIYAAQ